MYYVHIHVHTCICHMEKVMIFHTTCVMVLLASWAMQVGMSPASFNMNPTPGLPDHQHMELLAHLVSLKLKSPHAYVIYPYSVYKYIYTVYVHT